MPTYQYRCKSCSHEFEELQKISDEPLKICPSCKKPTLVRIIGGGAGLVFKGSGFYQTDYKKPGGKSKPRKQTPESKSSKAAPEDKNGSTEKKEAKTEPKPESKSGGEKESKPSDPGSSKSKNDSKE